MIFFSNLYQYSTPSTKRNIGEKRLSFFLEPTFNNTLLQSLREPFRNVCALPGVDRAPVAAVLDDRAAAAGQAHEAGAGKEGVDGTVEAGLGLTAHTHAAFDLGKHFSNINT